MILYIIAVIMNLNHRSDSFIMYNLFITKESFIFYKLAGKNPANISNHSAKEKKVNLKVIINLTLINICFYR